MRENVIVCSIFGHQNEFSWCPRVSWWFFKVSMLHEKLDLIRETKNQTDLILSFWTIFWIFGVDEMVFLVL
jgi:hypothetical protein